MCKQCRQVADLARFASPIAHRHSAYTCLYRTSAAVRRGSALPPPPSIMPWNVVYTATIERLHQGQSQSCAIHIIASVAALLLFPVPELMPGRKRCCGVERGTSIAHRDGFETHNSSAYTAAAALDASRQARRIQMNDTRIVRRQCSWICCLLHCLWLLLTCLSAESVARLAMIELAVKLQVGALR